MFAPLHTAPPHRIHLLYSFSNILAFVCLTIRCCTCTANRDSVRRDRGLLHAGVSLVELHRGVMRPVQLLQERSLSPRRLLRCSGRSHGDCCGQEQGQSPGRSTIPDLSYCTQINWQGNCVLSWFFGVNFPLICSLCSCSFD